MDLSNINQDVFYTLVYNHFMISGHEEIDLNKKNYEKKTILNQKHHLRKQKQN